MRPSARTVSISTLRSPLDISGSSTGSADAILQRRQSLDGERARVRVRVLGQRQQRRQRALVLEPLQRERHRPPAHARLTAAVEHGGRELRVRLQPDQRVDRQAARRRRRVAPHIVAFVGRLREGAGLHDLGDERADRVGGGRRRRSGRALRRRCPARAATDRRARATSGSRARRSPSRPSANAAICRTSGSGSASTPSSGVTPSASPTWPIASAARRRMRASSSDSMRIKIGRRRRRGGDGRRLLTAHGGGRRRRRSGSRRRIAQHALILEAQNPRHLLLEGRAASAPWRPPAPAARSRRPRPRAPARRAQSPVVSRRSRRSSVERRQSAVDASCVSGLEDGLFQAWPGRSDRRGSATPMPGAVGTAIVPSAATSIGGSIRSGSK